MTRQLTGHSAGPSNTPTKHFFIQAETDDGEDCSLFVEAHNASEAASLWMAWCSINDQNWDPDEFRIFELPLLTGGLKTLLWHQDVVVGS